MARQEEEEVSSSGNESVCPGDALATDIYAQKSLPTYRKSLQLSSEQTGRLNLKDGPNKAAFSVTTQYQGTCLCKATIYLWNWDDQVVISDIDGTITNKAGQSGGLPCVLLGNGYKFFYCSARAISTAHNAEGYPKWVNEQGCALPGGPSLLAPSSLFSASRREITEKKPEVIKTCLTDTQNLCAREMPFYAAVGNRASQDVSAYKQLGLLESHIFTVNPKGELIQELMKNHKSTHEQLSEVVELMFPPLGQVGEHGSAVP